MESRGLRVHGTCGTRRSRRHLPALRGTLAARVGAHATVFGHGCVAPAFLRTCIARGGARATELGGERASARHRAYRRVACVGAIPVEPDALRHHLHVLLVEARVRAHLARYEAGDAGLDAI